MTKHYDITLVGDGAVALVLLEFLLHFGVDKKHSIAWICPNLNNTSRASEEKRLFSLSVQSIDLLKHSGVYDKLGSFEEVRVEQLNIQYAHRHLQAWDAARQDALHQDVAFFSQLIPHAAFFSACKRLCQSCRHLPAILPIHRFSEEKPSSSGWQQDKFQAVYRG